MNAYEISLRAHKNGIKKIRQEKVVKGKKFESIGRREVRNVGNFKDARRGEYFIGEGSESKEHLCGSEVIRCVALCDKKKLETTTREIFVRKVFFLPLIRFFPGEKQIKKALTTKNQ